MTVISRFFYNLAKKIQKKYNRPLPAFKKQNSINYNKILILCTTAIGDTLLSTPVFCALRQEFPDAIIKVLVQKKFIPLFSDNPHVDGFIPFQKGIINFFKIVHSIKQDQFQLVLALQVSDPFPVYMTVLAKIPLLVGYSPDQLTSRFFSHVVDPPVGKHVIFHRLAVLEAIRPHHPVWSTRLILPLSTHDQRNKLQVYMKSGFPDPDKMTLVGFQPGASKQFKMWPVENFIMLGQELIQRNHKVSIVILGSPNEKKLADKITKGINRNDRVTSLCGLIPIGDLSLIVSFLKTLVTNDTGTMHIAIALKIPTVSLFVPTSHVGIGPIQDNEIHHVISRPRPCGNDCVTKKCSVNPSCMSLLPVDEVLDAVLQSIDT
ncbi:MAG: hypothetical protein BM485_07815 [Desulfobulbaceae bacterium DB1]|nr:MAG: hypothetical protein BM485_07815 [Desulfobulbaceae bacterium DB1]